MDNEIQFRQASNEVLRITASGQFIWHEDADKLIEEGDYSNSPAMRHILKALRKPWVGLNWDDIPDVFVGDIAFMQGAKWALAKLKEKNGG
jgi:hypothetical protein